MKHLNFTLTDEAHKRLEEIKKAKGIGNNSEAFEFLIDEVYKRMQEKQAKAKTVEIGVKGRLIHE